MNRTDDHPLRGKIFSTSIYLLIIGIYLIFRLAALWLLPMIGDEPDDFNILACDMPGILNFFSSPSAYSFDQARLPYLISAPLVYFLKERALIPLRILFLSFHLLYLFFSFKLVALLLHNRIAAWTYVLCITMSCYLASFSIFSITTSDNLYLLFHVVCIYYFIRSYREFNRTHTFPDYLLLTLLIAACIASKLFGILLLVALFIFHYFSRDKDSVIHIRSPQPRSLILIGISFFLGILITNLFFANVTFKLISTLLFSGTYLATIITSTFREHRRVLPLTKVRFTTFWASLVLTSFNLTLIFSPVYLNLHNVLKTFNWFNEWGSGLLVARSHYYDMCVIVVMKYGIASSLILLVLIITGSVIALKNTTGNFRQSPLFLFILIVTIHFTAISLVKHKVSWYPLAFFPFLYLPVIWLEHHAVKNNLKVVGILSILCVGLILTDNTIRYFYWFPYGHFDGAQYGREYIGWNRAGLVSYEMIPQLYRYLSTLEHSKKIAVNCHVVNVPLYNKWVTRLLRHYFADRGDHRFTFSSREFKGDHPLDYFLTSPLYYPEFEEQLRRKGLTKIKTLSIKGIDIVSIWK